MAKKGPPVMSGSELMAAVEIDPLNLNSEFIKVPAHLARYGEMYAEALREHLTAKHTLSRVYASCYLKHKLSAAENGERVTEPMIKARAECDTAYRVALDRAIAAEVEKARLGSAVEALRKKCDALISLGAHVRAELKGAPLIREDDEARGSIFDEDDLDLEVDD